MTNFIKILLLSFCLSFNSFAQESNKDDEKKKEEIKPAKKKFEKVKVTGSRIRRTDFEGPTPVKVISRKDIEDSPYNSVGDYFRDLTVSAFGSARESSGSGTAGSSSINIRGIGSTNTLVLMNGVRLQPNGISGAVDLNLIPQIAIESSDILKSGASAIYGSDALGGVVNLKTRKDFTGVEASVQLVVPEEEGGERIDFSVIGGKQFKDSSVTAAFQYRNNKYIWARDRKWSKAGTDGKNGFSPTGPIARFLNTSGKWQIRDADVAPCKADPSQYYYQENDNGNERCRYAFANAASNIPEIEQYSTYVNFNHNFDSRTRVDVVGMFSQQKTEWTYAATPGGITVARSAVDGWAAFTPAEYASMPTDNVSFAYRFIEGGNRVSTLTSNAYNGIVKLEREFGETWTINASTGYGYTDTNDVSPTGYFKKDALNAVLSSGAFNPYDPNRTVEDLGDAPFQPYQKTRAITYSADISASGEIMELPWNNLPLGVAIGTQYNHFYYTSEADAETTAGNNTGGAGSNGGNNRDVGSVYIEFVAPLLQKLELQAAARFDWFSDYGTAFSPMAAVKYQPFKDLLLRTSVAKGYKAPLMQELYSEGGNGFPTFIDQKACEDGGRSESNASCSPQQWFVTSEAPDELDAEEAITYNLGAVYEPVRGLSIVVDGWMADISNVIGVDYEQITQAEADGKSALLNDAGIVVNRVGGLIDDSGGTKGLNVPTQNLATRKQAGVDVEISYAFSTKIGNFRLSNEYSRALKFEQELLPGLPVQDYLDDFGTPKWRNNIGLSYAPARGHVVKVDYKMIAGQKTQNRFGRLPSYGEVDLTYTTRILKKGNLKVGIKNILGDTPPFDENTGLNSGLYNDWGRYAFVNYRHAF